MSRTGHGWRLAATELGTVASTWQLPDGTSFPQHRHGVHQLSFAGTSAIALGVADRTWVLPRGRGLWVPAGVSHSVEPIGAAEMITLWFEPERCPVRWDRPTVVDADDLLLALVDRLLDESLTTAERTRSERVLFDVLRPVPVDRLDLALPSDDRARRVAEAVLVDPGDARTLAAWGRAVGASERTLMRAFRAGDRCRVPGVAHAGADGRRPAAPAHRHAGVGHRPGGRLRDHECVQRRLPAHDGCPAVRVPGCLTSPGFSAGR